MSDINDFIERVHAYARRRECSTKTVSRLLFGGGNRLAEIEEGNSFPRLDTFQKALRKLEELERAA
ncbi:hypothetical protein [Rhizorhapis sp.]|uniref:hypothetical protein n=1 Tax=Rhizorhapis sp. TaxID=1968842 RepID=UPI002B48FE77|nr:hypothetical protein [Rhizorhapis sp.]